MSEKIQQLNLFNFDKEKKIITKPLRLIELFSGIGSQHKAMTVLTKICPGFKFESWKTCEWAVPSIKSYNAIHIRDFTNYSKDLSKEELIDYLQGNISTDYNQPCDVIKKDLEILEIIKELLFYVPSHYENQANWGNEYISMSYIDKTWTKPKIYEKVKQWCFENEIRGTKENK